MRRNPFQDLEELFERMERGFDVGMDVRSGSVDVDVVDRSDEYVVTADLPGYSAEDMEVTFSDGRLRIAADQEEEAEMEDERYIRRERRHTAAERTVRIPDAVDEGGIEAAYDDGVLTVTLPKEDAGDGGRRIEIE